jgi:hypothetical protein
VAVVDLDVLSFDIAEIAQALAERLEPRCVRAGRNGGQVAHARHFPGLLLGPGSGAGGKQQGAKKKPQVLAAHQISPWELPSSIG